MSQPPVAIDTDLISRVREGDVDAFAELVQRYKQRAYYAALGIVGSHDDALDLSQEAFARTYRARGTIDPERPFFTWFYQVLRRLCFNHLRNRKRYAKRLERARPWLEHVAGAAAPANPEEAVVREELRARVRAAIDTLPAHEREALVLREFEGLKYREIAELLGIPEGTVMSRLYSARRRLATAIGEAS